MPDSRSSKTSTNSIKWFTSSSLSTVTRVSSTASQKMPDSAISRFKSLLSVSPVLLVSAGSVNTMTLPSSTSSTSNAPTSSAASKTVSKSTFSLSSATSSPQTSPSFLLPVNTTRPFFANR